VQPKIPDLRILNPFYNFPPKLVIRIHPETIVERPIAHVGHRHDGVKGQVLHSPFAPHIRPRVATAFGDTVRNKMAIVERYVVEQIPGRWVFNVR
jgi:hypothetical protein